jgi:integrase
VTVNPCTKAIEFNPEQPRSRDITPDERIRIIDELAKHHTQSATALKLLMVIGARRGEVLGMKWSDITFGEHPTWRRYADDQKSKKDHTVPLNRVAAQMLLAIRDETLTRDGQLGEFVFPSDTKSQHIADIRKMWLLVLRNAKVDDVHIHDLRHHFASQLASGGASLGLIGQLLGHRSSASTFRYARFFQDAQREASERAGAAITGTDTGNVVPMKREAR